MKINKNMNKTKEIISTHKHKTSLSFITLPSNFSRSNIYLKLYLMGI